jgi:hypothetical protein
VLEIGAGGFGYGALFHGAVVRAGGAGEDNPRYGANVT